MTVKTGGEIEKTMSSLVTKFFFWSSVIVIAFLPGGIYIIMFLLTIYYVVPMFLDDKNEYTIKFVIKDSSQQNDSTQMNQYDSETLEGMK